MKFEEEAPRGAKFIILYLRVPALTEIESRVQPCPTFPTPACGIKTQNGVHTIRVIRGCFS